MFIDLLLKVSWNTKMCPNHQTDVITVIQRKWFHSAVDAKSWSQSGGLSNLFFWCLQCAKISCLEFRVADLGLNAIWYFSLIHSWRLLQGCMLVCCFQEFSILLRGLCLLLIHSKNKQIRCWVFRYLCFHAGFVFIKSVFEIAS